MIYVLTTLCLAVCAIDAIMTVVLVRGYKRAALAYSRSVAVNNENIGRIDRNFRSAEENFTLIAAWMHEANTRLESKEKVVQTRVFS